MTVKILTSNYYPLETEFPTFVDQFKDQLFDTESLYIAVGYISEISLTELVSYIGKNGRPRCNLVIGMHYFEKFTRTQYATVRDTEKFLTTNNLGSVKLVTSFPFHGKLYSFKKESGSLYSILGSSNLTNITDQKSKRQYELDLLVTDYYINKELLKFIKQLISISDDFSSVDSKKITILMEDDIMDRLEKVKKMERQDEVIEIKDRLHVDHSIDIPIKTNKQSGINAYFGKGRENKSTGVIKNRPWYEAELIVPSTITELEWYPKNKDSIGKKFIFDVVTDDGYEFRCITSGSYNKNLRSEGDLTVLGRWLKGRLENAGALEIGEMVTEKVLLSYGRKSISITPTIENNLWYIDFGIES